MRCVLAALAAILRKLNFARHQLLVFTCVVVGTLAGSTAQLDEIFGELGLGHRSVNQLVS